MWVDTVCLYMSETLSTDDAALIYKHLTDHPWITGFKGVDMTAHEIVWDRWKDERPADLEYLESHDQFDIEPVDYWKDDTGSWWWDFGDQEAYHDDEKIERLADDYAKEKLDEIFAEIQRRQAESGFSPKQFMVFILGEQTNRQYAHQAMEMPLGTYDSHKRRADKKVERAQRTVDIADVFAE